MDNDSTENLIISIDFDKQMFPRKYTCDGENVSPPIHIGRIHSKYLAIIVEDQIGPDYVFNHWLIWNIEARPEIPENIPKDPVISRPFTAVQGKNDAGKTGYSGPCPPAKEIHTYYFNVYGLDSLLDLEPGSDRKKLEKAMEKHMVQYGGQAIANYQRK
jgi:Raf kinase inhibitor-like YbhB/YbcL family protein